MLLSFIVSSYFSVSLYFLLNNKFTELLKIDINSIIGTMINNPKVFVVFIALEIIMISFLILFVSKRKNIYHSQKIKLTDKIEIPKPVGEGQYGTSWWLDKKEYDNLFNYNIINRNNKYNKNCFNSGGVIVNFERDNNIEKISYIGNNQHILLVGSSGSGKTRSVIIPTITMLGLAGENMFISDVKGELYLYTAEKLKELGYNVIAIDYINFLKSNCYNFLDIVINAIEDDNISLAESLINDIATILVEKNEKTEPIWKNGEQSVIKTAIMAVVLENKGKREYQTLANAYYFVAEMFKADDEGVMIIDKYMKEKEANDPIKKFYAVARTCTFKN